MKTPIAKNSQGENFQSLEVCGADFSNDWKFSPIAGSPEINGRAWRGTKTDL